MPQLGVHIYPDTAEGKAAYEAMKARVGGQVANKPEGPPATVSGAVPATPGPVKPKRKPKE